jgi:KDO2-lipid IV(A) lauroyltransferase
MKKFGYYILGGLLRALLFITNLVPEKVIYSFSKNISSLYFRFAIRYRRRIAQNLRIAFGPLFDKHKINSISHTLSENLGLNFAETLISATHKKQAVLDAIQVHGIEHLDNALAQGREVLAFSGHFGNFTLIALKMASLGYRFHMLVKEPRYSAVAEAFRMLQTGQGGLFIYVEPWEKALRQILTCLKKNEIVCILADEKKSRNAVTVDFFGYPAPTAPGPSVLSLRTGAPLVPVFIARKQNGEHHIYIEPQLELNLNGDRTKDIATVIGVYTKVIENYIRQYPDQWFWINNRWKKKTRDNALRNS